MPVAERRLGRTKVDTDDVDSGTSAGSFVSLATSGFAGRASNTGEMLATSRTRADEDRVSPPMSRLVADLSLHVTLIYDRREEATDGRGGQIREDGGIVRGCGFVTNRVASPRHREA